MRIEYSRDADALYVYFRQVPVAHSRELGKDVLVDFGEDGEIVGVEVLGAKKKFGPADLSNVTIENLPVDIPEEPRKG